MTQQQTTTVTTSGSATEDVLARIPIFAGLSEADRSALYELMKAERFGPQQPVFWIGEAGTDLYLIQHGGSSSSPPTRSARR